MSALVATTRVSTPERQLGIVVAFVAPVVGSSALSPSLERFRFCSAAGAGGNREEIFA
jgi:hypothetical protein